MCQSDTEDCPAMKVPASGGIFYQPTEAGRRAAREDLKEELMAIKSK